MKDLADTRNGSSSRQLTPGMIVCPACGGPLKPDSKWCPTCNFTGGDSIRFFPDSPPPLLPILDAAEIFTEADTRKIERVREAIGKRFPQFRWRVCSVNLPQETRLSLFGFWLLNASPLAENETSDERTWTVLLLINANTGQAAVILGYAAEPFLSDDDWKNALSSMASDWQAGNPSKAVGCFFKNTRILLDQAAARFGSRRTDGKIR